MSKSHKPSSSPIALRTSKENDLLYPDFFQRLLAETADAREEFLQIPIIGTALQAGISRELYIAYLGEAYHHVRHTCPLLAAALARCGECDGRYREALLDYLQEERGHEQWILNDIEALGGDAKMVRNQGGSEAVRIMVGYAYYIIEREDPYAFLGMVHVLEGMSVALAERAVESIGRVLGAGEERGFSYLRSHGSLDQEHVTFFQDLVNGIDDRCHEDAIIDCARVVYRLFGQVFRDLGHTSEGRRHAA